MPADHLTLTTGQLVDRVEAVLAGTALEHSAVDDLDLTDAVETYRAAGRAALHHHRGRAWFHARLTWPDWDHAETAFAEHVAPRLDQLGAGGAWWFLRKYPHWRLRVRPPEHRGIAILLDSLVADGTITSWRPGIYEPETAAFGGERAMAIVHTLFCADSRGVLTYARQDSPGLGRREVSLLLLRGLQQHAGLDWFETGDVFDLVAQLRPPLHETTRVDELAAKLRPLLAIQVSTRMPLFAPGGPVAYANTWLAAFLQAGQDLADAAADNRLDRGLRATIAQIVIFHWNRLGLPAHTQGILAHAAKSAALPRS